MTTEHLVQLHVHALHHATGLDVLLRCCCAMCLIMSLLLQLRNGLLLHQLVPAAAACRVTAVRGMTCKAKLHKSVGLHYRCLQRVGEVEELLWAPPTETVCLHW